MTDQGLSVKLYPSLGYTRTFEVFKANSKKMIHSNPKDNSTRTDEIRPKLD